MVGVVHLPFVLSLTHRVGKREKRELGGGSGWWERHRFGSRHPKDKEDSSTKSLKPHGPETPYTRSLVYSDLLLVTEDERMKRSTSPEVPTLFGRQEPSLHTTSGGRLPVTSLPGPV